MIGSVAGRAGGNGSWEVESVANRNEWQPGTAARGRDEPGAGTWATAVAVLDTTTRVKRGSRSDWKKIFNAVLTGNKLLTVS
jgi:hypothetical protein